MARDLTQRAVDAAILPVVTSLAPWGVESGHWLPSPDGEPVVWLRTRTEIERVALEAQSWVLPHLRMILIRLQLPPDKVGVLRLEISSAEGESRLFEE